MKTEAVQCQIFFFHNFLHKVFPLKAGMQWQMRGLHEVNGKNDQ